MWYGINKKKHKLLRILKTYVLYDFDFFKNNKHI